METLHGTDVNGTFHSFCFDKYFLCHCFRYDEHGHRHMFGGDAITLFSLFIIVINLGFINPMFQIVLEIDNTSNKLKVNYICRRALLFDIIIVCYNFLFLNLDKRTCISDKLIQVHINTGSHHKVYWRQC